MADWKTLSTRVAYENPYIYVEENDVINPARQRTVYGVTSSKSNGGVFIVPVDQDGKTYIVRQFRYPKQKITWECIAGWADESDLKAGALRELFEETAVKAGKMTQISQFNVANGATTLYGTLFLAEDITRTDGPLDPTDGILEIKKVSFDQINDMIMDGDIQCSESITAFFIAREFLKRRDNGSTNN